MNKKSSLLALGAIAAGLAAWYCFAGYAMNASFFDAAERRSYSVAAVLWAGAGLVSLVAAAGLAIAAWRKRRG
jgi:hypothetical protein